MEPREGHSDARLCSVCSKGNLQHALDRMTSHGASLTRAVPPDTEEVGVVLLAYSLGGEPNSHRAVIDRSTAIRLLGLVPRHHRHKSTQPGSCQIDYG